MFFAGTFKPKLDDKGRLFLPAKFRDAMGGGLVMTRGQERSIDVRTQADFDVFAAKLQNTPQTDARLRAYARMLFSMASEQTPDKQGRITVTPELREYSSVQRDCVVIGVYNRIEIWEPAAWAEYTATQEQSFSDVSEEIFPGV